VPTRQFDDRVADALEPFVYEWVARRGGSISAEHGLGLAKKAYIGYSKNETMIRLMKQIKNLYDPVSQPVWALALGAHTDGGAERDYEPL
jgi:(R)-2-hydroxyglutarate---pyruvate transhydrogenase